MTFGPARKLPGLCDRKWGSISNTTPLAIAQPRGFGAGPNGTVIALRALSERLSLLEAEPTASRAWVKAVISGPENVQNNPCTDEYLKVIGGAQKTLTFAQMAIIEPKIVKATTEAIEQRKIKVTAITNGTDRTTSRASRLLGYRTWAFFSRLFNAKVRPEEKPDLYTYQGAGEGVLYHKKVLVADEAEDSKATTICGSYNITSKSAYCDDEMILVVQSGEFARNTTHILQEDIRRSIKIIPRYGPDGRYTPNLLERVKIVVGRVLYCVLHQLDN